MTTIRLKPEARARWLASGKRLPTRALPVTPQPQPATPEQAARAALTEFLGATPPCFEHLTVLAVGIHGQLLARYPQVDPRHLHVLLARLTRTRAYQRLLATEGMQRHDLDGVPVGAVEHTHRAFAQEKLKCAKPR